MKTDFATYRTSTVYLNVRIVGSFYVLFGFLDVANFRADSQLVEMENVKFLAENI